MMKGQMKFKITLVVEGGEALKQELDRGVIEESMRTIFLSPTENLLEFHSEQLREGLTKIQHRNL